MSTQKSKLYLRIRALCEGALLIALAEILSFLPLYKFPWGGSIDLAMLPIIFYAVRWGFGPAMICSTAHALLQTMFAGGIAIGWESIVGDFLLAYMALGVAGLLRGKYALATVSACGLRWFIHYVVGATIWAEYMPESFFGMTMTTPWIYSALYNGAYMLPDMLMILAAFLLISKTPLNKYLTCKDLM